MPTYSYACTACEHRFDTVQAFTDSSLTECPECRGRLRKLFSSVGIVFKGSGFYRTDSRANGGNGSGGDASKSESPPSPSESGPAGKSGKESGAAAKPAAKADSSSSSGGRASSSSSAKSASPAAS